jgi:hypothetical protein
MKRPNQPMKPTAPSHVYEIRPRKDHRRVDLISDMLPFNDAVDDKAKLQQSRTV